MLETILFVSVSRPFVDSLSILFVKYVCVCVHIQRSFGVSTIVQAILKIYIKHSNPCTWKSSTKAKATETNVSPRQIFERLSVLATNFHLYSRSSKHGISFALKSSRNNVLDHKKSKQKRSLETTIKLKHPTNHTGNLLYYTSETSHDDDECTFWIL